MTPAAMSGFFIVSGEWRIGNCQLMRILHSLCSLREFMAVAAAMTWTKDVSREGVEASVKWICVGVACLKSDDQNQGACLEKLCPLVPDFRPDLA